MNRELLERIKKGIASGKRSDELKSDLESQGFMSDEVVDALQEIKGTERSVEDKRNVNIFTFKEVFDRVGYGFSSTQFINILFYLIGAGYFWIGIVNGLKSVLSLLISSFLQEYSKVKRVSIKFISKCGILFGFSFLFIAMAIVIKSVALFSFALLIGAVGVVAYGDLYERLADEYLKKEKLGKFLLNISHFGVIITGLSMILSGLLFDVFPMMGAQRMILFGRSLPLFGFLICFEITAISFIMASYVLHFVKEKELDDAHVKGFFWDYLSKVKEQFRVLFSSKHLLLLLLASAVTGLVQILGNSYYGIFIYQKFADGTFFGFFDGAFLNIAFIFLLAIVFSFAAPSFSAYLNKRVGLAPTLVFGSLLIAIMPLVAVYNPGFLPLMVANGLGVVGSAILGMGQGLLVRKLLREDQRSMYYAALGIGVVIPFVIFIPLGAFIAQSVGMAALFKLLALVILAVVAPIYFILVLLANKQRL